MIPAIHSLKDECRRDLLPEMVKALVCLAATILHPDGREEDHHDRLCAMILNLIGVKNEHGFGTDVFVC